MIKRLAACIREFRLQTILTPLFMCGEVGMEVLIPLLIADLIDNGIDAGNMDHILKTGVTLMVVCSASMLFGSLSGNFAAIASSGFAKNLRSDMYYRIQDYSFENIDKFSSASLVTRLTTDVTNVQNAFQMLIRIAVRSPIMFIFSLVMAFRIHRRLSLVFLCVIPVLAIGLYLIMTHAHPIFVRVFKTYDKLNGVVQENLRGIRVVKAYVREEFEEKKFKNVSESIYDDFTKAEKLIAFNSPLMQFSMYTCALLISWFGAQIVVNSTGSPSPELTTGSLTSLFTYSTQILSSLMMISMVFVMMTISRASANRIYEVLTEESTLTDPADPVYEVGSGDIEFQNVSFSYAGDKDKLCLSNVNLSIKSGETVGIIGSTGSSKSTLVQLVSRLYDVTEGAVLVGGIDVRKYDIKALRDQVAMVLQKNVLFSGTIKDNLRWGDENATDEDMKRVCVLACADEFISSFPDGYDTYIEQGGTNVSGGQKQRLCIARALLKKPKILILDDSTSAVDTRTDAMIRKAFAEEIPDTTKIIIAQRISSVENADKIIVMDGGRIAACGTHDQLLRESDIYRDVYESQTKGGEGNE